MSAKVSLAQAVGGEGGGRAPHSLYVVARQKFPDFV